MNYSLSDRDIRSALPDCLITTYKDLTTLDKIPDKDTVILYETRKGYGHWCLVIPLPHIIYFFDSYGIIPDDELSYVPENLRKMLGEDWPHLTALLYLDGRPIDYNNHKFQADNSQITTCGRWCVLRALNKHMDSDEFNRMIKKVCKRDSISPDELVVNMVNVPEKQEGIIGGLDLLYPVKKAFQLASNKYRKGQKFKLDADLAQKYGQEYAYSRPLDIGQSHILSANYAGPGTKITKYADTVPINHIDDLARDHDFAYLNAKSPQEVREADRIFLEGIENYKNEEPYYSLAKAGIEGKQVIEAIPLVSNLLGKYKGSE